MLFTASINSMTFPAMGYISSKVQMILQGNKYNSDWQEERSFYLWLYLGLCLVTGIASGAEKALFTITGENLTYNVRRDLIRGILFKQVSWFDR